jgi:hypothetical protein
MSISARTLSTSPHQQAEQYAKPEIPLDKNMLSFTDRFIATGWPSSYSTPEAPPSPDRPSIFHLAAQLPRRVGTGSLPFVGREEWVVSGRGWWFAWRGRFECLGKVGSWGSGILSTGPFGWLELLFDSGGRCSYLGYLGRRCRRGVSCEGVVST